MLNFAKYYVFDAKNKAIKEDSDSPPPPVLRHLSSAIRHLFL